jgi:hypothetical protein
MHRLLVRLLKILGVIAASIVGLAALAIGALGYFTQDMCANSVLTESVAPSGRLKAVVFERDCGATTNFSTQVSILPASETLSNEGGNVFVADRVGGIRLSWRSDAQLRIEHHANARLFKTETLYKNVGIEYASVK